MSLNAGTGEISGIASLAGTYNFTVEATDSAGTPQIVSQALSIVIDDSGLAVTTASLRTAK